jgi:hypothetical protein
VFYVLEAVEGAGGSGMYALRTKEPSKIANVCNGFRSCCARSIRPVEGIEACLVLAVLVVPEQAAALTPQAPVAASRLTH